MKMRRRAFLATCGVTVAVPLSGCNGGNGEGEEPTETTPNLDSSTYQTYPRGDVDVPLAPVDAAYYWYQNDEAHFADARGRGQYENTHIPGAVHSRAGTDLAGDPVQEIPKSDLIITYCGCPHTLSTQRAATLLENGWEEVYAIDEGIGGWDDNGYPLNGSNHGGESYEIQGETDEGDAGDYAWAIHEPSDQIEATQIATDGTYEMTLHFVDLDSDSQITVRTPSYEITEPLSEVTDGVVTGP